jgi:hypothetical protein
MFLLLIIFASKILIGGEDSYLGCLQKELRKFNRQPEVDEKFGGNNIRATCAILSFFCLCKNFFADRPGLVSQVL